MRLCRFDTDRVGVLRGDRVVDVTSVLDSIPATRWPFDPGDLLIANFGRLKHLIDQEMLTGEPRHLADCALKSPVANPSKILGALNNYHEPADDADYPVSTLDRDGLFLKASTSLAGPSDGIELAWPGRQHDHEVELAVVIGSWCRNVSRERAMDHVVGYTVALDMTMKGSEERGLRKSLDAHTVLGPWLITRDEIADPGNLGLWLQVNRQPRQRGNTRNLLNDVPRLIEYVSSFFTLYPGDILLTGTPPGAGPVAPGDIIDAGIVGVGSMRVEVR
ncbi:MAG TPA: fumarylacetoacetate hydrolase family protein [Steroidobacter sp.]|uniref:fumarylacetoacetate hydrolase family protein n=1 Tax=Steroidobacter sp. TaxID=1978227 RepID=UPI002ED7875A